MIMSLKLLVELFLISRPLRTQSLLQLVQKISCQRVRKSKATVVTRAAVGFIGHPDIAKLLRLVYRLVAFRTEEVRWSWHPIVGLFSRANIPFVISVTKFPDQRQMSGPGPADLVTFPAVVHVRKILTRSRLRPHAMALKTG